MKTGIKQIKIIHANDVRGYRLLSRSTMEKWLSNMSHLLSDNFEIFYFFDGEDAPDQNRKTEHYVKNTNITPLN